MEISSRNFGSMVKHTLRYPYYLCPVIWCHALLTWPRRLYIGSTSGVSTTLDHAFNVMAPLEFHYDVRALTKIIPCAPAISCSLHVYRTSF